MSKLQIALDITRTIVITLILFIIIGVLVFIYVNKDVIGIIITNITDTINIIKQAFSNINSISYTVNAWIKNGNVLTTTDVILNNANIIFEKNKNVDISAIVDKLNTIVTLLQNISGIVRPTS